MIPWAIPRMLSWSASFTTGTTRPCWFRSTAIPRLTYGCSVMVLASTSIEELTVGNARSASTTARETKGRYDSEEPVSFLNRSLCLARTLSTLS